MEDAAQRSSNAAQQCEDAATRIAHLLEDGYGGNGLRLIEELEGYNSIRQQEYDDILAAVRQTLEDNLHLCDGDNCTLRVLRDAAAKLGVA